MLRAHHFVGAAITGAVSAIDIALWDLKGKSLAYRSTELLGGAIRQKARLYAHVKGATIGKQVALTLHLKEQGFTAIGHLNPLLDEDISEPYFRAHARKMRDAIDNVRAYREALGDEVDLCIEIHRRLTVPEAVTLARGIEQFHPMFFEDPIPPANPDAMAWIAGHIPIPIATGERYTSLHQFQTLLGRRGVQFLRPCICVCGGITGGQEDCGIGGGIRRADRSAQPALAREPRRLPATRRCNSEPCHPGISQREPRDRGPRRAAWARHGHGPRKAGRRLHRDPQRPGARHRAVPGAEDRVPPKARPIEMRPHVDGSVVDQ